MKKIENMTDFEMAEEIYELNRKIPNIKKRMEQDKTNQLLAKELETKSHRLAQLCEQIDYNKVNFVVDGQTLKEHLEQFFKTNYKMFARLYLKTNNGKTYLLFWVNNFPYEIMEVDSNTASLANVKVDLKEFIMKSNENNVFEQIMKIVGIKNLHLAMFNALRGCQQNLNETNV